MLVPREGHLPTTTSWIDSFNCPGPKMEKRLGQERSFPQQHRFLLSNLENGFSKN
jgi:hypothetical protein